MKQVATTLLTPREVAAQVGVTLGTLVDWRFRRVGPPFIKVGKLVRYPLDALESWLQVRMVSTRPETNRVARTAR